MSQQVRIGAVSRLADRNGTHEPGDIVDAPSPALLALADAATIDPETGDPYCELVGKAPKKTPAPEPEPPADAPAPDAPTPENT